MSFVQMSAALARALRLFALLALVLVSTASHDVAMASGAMDGAHGSTSVHHAVAHHGTDNACAVIGCEQPEPPCCVMGQCLLAIPLIDSFEFFAAALPDPEALVPAGRIAGIVRAPFRPPATV